MSIFSAVMIIVYFGLAVSVAVLAFVYIVDPLDRIWYKHNILRQDRLKGEQEKLLHANSMALNSFIQSLADYLAAQPEQEQQTSLERLAPMISFCDDNTPLNHEVLRILCLTEQFKAEMEVKRETAVILADNEEQKTPQDAPLSHVQNTANHLIETRNALAFFLRMHRNLSTRNLDGQFLAGANLNSAMLSRASCKETILIGANLMNTPMRRIHLENAYLNGADMAGTRLLMVLFENTNLSGTNIQGVHFIYCDLTSAIVAGSNLDLAHITNGSWKNANFEWNGIKDEALYERMKMKFDDLPESVEEEMAEEVRQAHIDGRVIID